MNATVEGQTTAHYITDRLAGSGAKVTRLAHGVPVGGELDYLDDGTLCRRHEEPHAVLKSVVGRTVPPPCPHFPRSFEFRLRNGRAKVKPANLGCAPIFEVVEQPPGVRSWKCSRSGISSG